MLEEKSGLTRRHDVFATVHGNPDSDRFGVFFFNIQAQKHTHI